jgi:hypothetical protein
MSFDQGIGYPDWYPQQKVAGTVYGILDFVTEFTYAGPYYLGGSTSLNIWCNLVTTTPWKMSLAWFQGGNGENKLYEQFYYGTTNCLVVDGVPALTPYLSVGFGPITAGNSVEAIGWMTSTMVSQSGSGFLPNAGMFIQVYGQSIDAGATTTLVSPYLCPGLHQLLIAAEAAGVIAINVQVPNQGVIPVLATLNTTSGVVGLDERQIIIPNVQPQIEYQNTASSAGSIYATLARSL